MPTRKNFRSLNQMQKKGRIEKFIFKRLKPNPKYFILEFIVSIGLITVLSWFLVHFAIKTAEMLLIPEFIIAVTVLAVGTSIPDFMSSVIVARKGRTGMAINNSLGSNVFDIQIGIGLPVLLVLLFSGGTLAVGNKDLPFSFGLLMGSVLIVFISLGLNKWKTSRWIGGLLLLAYAIYIGFEIYWTAQ